MEVLIRLVTWALGYILNALSFIHIGKQNEKVKNQSEYIKTIDKASNARARLKYDSDYAEWVRDKFTRK